MLVRIITPEHVAVDIRVAHKNDQKSFVLFQLRDYLPDTPPEEIHLDLRELPCQLLFICQGGWVRKTALFGVGAILREYFIGPIQDTQALAKEQL